MSQLGILYRHIRTLNGSMIDLLATPQQLPDWPLHLVKERLSASYHGDFEHWLSAINSLPVTAPRHHLYDDTISAELACDQSTLQAIERALLQLHPWRKGPFRIGDLYIDTEWRSDWKWQRLRRTLGDLSGQRVLDIGCGNGYFGWRALQAGAAEVIGIDPTILFCMQHHALQKFFDDKRNWVLPIKVEELPTSVQFDLTLSMGVLYHRRNPMQHIQHLFDLTTAGGRCILETLVVTAAESLYPSDRYARMRNVWCVPSTAQVLQWMQRAGFEHVQIIDVSATTTDEQRRTEWMRFDSLSDCLDQDDSSRTVEGHPAPVRAMYMGSRRS